MEETWLIYALGGGWGHITRALSLGRIAATQRKVKIITNSPYTYKIEHDGCFVHFIPEYANFSETCLQVREILCNSHYDCLIIDTFPRGLGAELADILPKLNYVPRILIHRDINSCYVSAKQLRPFVIENFDKVIIPGEGEDLPFADLPIVEHTAPWLIRNCWELPDKATMRSHILRVNPYIKTILVCASGKTSDLTLFAELTLWLQHNFPDCAVRILAATCPQACPQELWISHHPGIECIAAADIVIGSAGYNTVYECAAVGVPLVAIPLERLYDRQHKRAYKSYWVQNNQDTTFDEQLLNIYAMVRRILDEAIPAHSLPIPSYINGAVKATRQIEQI
ncbi:UDP-N-acetylglucosamine--LPS N-acetylglucosamine transferase [Tolypothrix sp. PCC 7910]|uniref:glycosyltransferase n=1 Tax=Tolypothrix sp. PCC 7910 TaxID=2099387 RepID=UPI00142784D2|nr:glycosyltransferase [Tolypothrix sp. PCC 7910]QIR40733.1 UDP-N-acetylglucosamine--LPS N-acetylglucosamine transferase [Tolypothrix sp. PCC 7910]